MLGEDYSSVRSETKSYVFNVNQGHLSIIQDQETIML